MRDGVCVCVHNRLRKDVIQWFIELWRVRICSNATQCAVLIHWNSCVAICRSSFEISADFFLSYFMFYSFFLTSILKFIANTRNNLIVSKNVGKGFGGQGVCVFQATMLHFYWNRPLVWMKREKHKMTSKKRKEVGVLPMVTFQFILLLLCELMKMANVRSN